MTHFVCFIQIFLILAIETSTFSFQARFCNQRCDHLVNTEWHTEKSSCCRMTPYWILCFRLGVYINQKFSAQLYWCFRMYEVSSDGSLRWSFRGLPLSAEGGPALDLSRLRDHLETDAEQVWINIIHLNQVSGWQPDILSRLCTYSTPTYTPTPPPSFFQVTQENLWHDNYMTCLLTFKEHYKSSLF